MQTTNNNNEQTTDDAASNLQELRDAYMTAYKAIDSMKEPIVQLSILCAAMNDALDTDRLATDISFATFYHEDLAPGLARRLSKERSNDKSYLQVIAEIFEVMFRLFAQELQQNRLNYSLCTAMTQLFNHESTIHKFHFQISSADLQKLRTQQQVWRQTIGVGDWCDVLCQADERSRIQGWLQGQIIEVVDVDTLKVEFPLSPLSFDKKVNRWSTDLLVFQSKTKQDYEWRQIILSSKEDLECEVHDKSTWNKSTILTRKEVKQGPDRSPMMAHCALRVYRDIPNSLRKDERGTYDGWSSKFDEWVPVFSPRIFPWGAKIGVIEEQELDDTIDDLVEKEKEFETTFAVPRPGTCMSGVYVRCINIFGNVGGFKTILKLLQTAKDEDIDITTMGCLAQIITQPYPVYHKNFIEMTAQDITEAIKKRLIGTSDQALRNVRKEQVDAIIKSVENISRRVLNKDDREKQSEVLRLELCNKSLISNYLERRISGIRDLSQLVKNNTLNSSSKTFTTEFLIEWMVKNDVFNTIWDHKKTHLQIVQRTNEIFKFLVKDDRMDESLLKLFWSLGKADITNQTEVFKIISEANYYLKQSHIEFFFNELTAQSADKFTQGEFDCLCDLGKTCKIPEFQGKIRDFFWSVIIQADNYKEDLVENCITKYAEIVKSWTLAQKQTIFAQLVDQLKGDGAVIPLIHLLTKLIKDHVGDKIFGNTITTTSNYQPVQTYSHTTGDGTIITSYSYGPQMPYVTAPETTHEESKQEPMTAKEELTFKSVLNQLHTELGIVDTLLDNLFQYCKAVRVANIDPAADSRKVFVSSKNYSHADEIQERMQFLKFYASVCDYQFRKVQLRVIYDSLSVESPLLSDQTQFLNWCKQSCQETTSDNVVLDLNEVGEYFSELMINKSLNLETLPMAGFEFLSNYFISVNESQSNLLKQTKKYKKQTVQKQRTFNMQSWADQSQTNKETEQKVEDQDFNILIDPSKLEKLELVWMVVLKVQKADVAARAVDFLIKIYMSLDECLQEQRATFCQQLITNCIDRLQAKDLQSSEIERIIQILQTVIQESERKGAGGVQPHNAILKGETLDRIIVKNSTKMHAPNIIVKVLTSATAWEFVDRVSRMVGLAPQFVEVKLKSGKVISEFDHGKTLGELGFSNYDIVTVNKLFFEEQVVVEYQPIDESTGKFTEKARKIFSEWYDLYSTADGVMTPESTTRFILGATHEVVGPEDGRITGLFNGYDANKDGILEREEFLTFYETATKDKLERVQDNLSNHFIRKDLVKMSDLYEEAQFTKDQMPRYTLSHNQDQFDTLFGLLDRQDSTSQQVWELIRMLATNHKVYQHVLNLDIKGSQEDWKTFFESGSIQKQNYAHEIIEALMEDNEDLTQRVFFQEFQDHQTSYRPYSEQTKHTEATQDESAKQTWSTKFIKNGGLNYVLNTFNTMSTSNEDGFQLQRVKFVVSLLKVYLTAAISALPNPQVTESLNLPQNFIDIPIDYAQIKLADLIETQNLKLLKEVNFEQLQSKLLQLIETLVAKQTHSFEEKNIISNALNLWMHCQLHTHGDYLRTEQLLVMQGLLYCSEEKVRIEFQQTLLRLAKSLCVKGESQSVHGSLLKMLSKNFSQISKYPCRQFFDLFNELVDMHFVKAENGNEEPNLFNAEDLLGQIIDKIRSDKRESQEAKSEEIDEIKAQRQAVEKESLIVGLVNLTSKIISKVDKSMSEKIVKQKDLIQEIFKEFLFASVFQANQPSTNDEAKSMLEVIRNKAPRKVKLSSASTGKVVNKSREAAYQLLNELIRKSPVIMTNFIRDQLKPLLEMIKKPKGWNYTPPSSSERIQKYVGLRNLGAICYMNSMMQQFFMIPAFRYNLLCVDDGIAPEFKEHRDEQIDDNMLHQMQRLFAHLELSERMDYNPLSFTYAFKEPDNKTPTNTGEQKDAQEFLTFLFDRLERALMPTPRKYLLQSVFGGKNCQQLICPECHKVKNRIEDFYNLSLTVKDINSVYESLQTLITGEVISDYNCEGCDKKVDITKRTLISQTPNVLIVHLQRLLFDFDTFRNEKNNEHFAFPYKLDLKDYTYHEVMKRENRFDKEKKEGSDDEDQEPEVMEEGNDKVPDEDDCFEYKLVGVNVHSGTANAGHYWSYINTERGMEEKDSQDPTWAETETEQWMEFNDSTVKDYKFENLKDECFGEKQQQQTMSTWGYSSSSSYGKSAYMLFYERRVKKPLKIVVPEEQAKLNPDAYFYDEAKKEYIKHIDFKEGVDNETPNQIFTKVLEDNTKFTFENDVYSQEFFNFLKEILQNVAHFGESQDGVNQEMRKLGIDVAQKAAFDILARCFYNAGIKDIVQVMIQIFSQDTKLVTEFMTSIVGNPEIILEVLLDCTDSTARSACGDLFKYLITVIKMTDSAQLLSENHADTVSAKFIELLASNLHTRVAKNWARFEKYLELFVSFALYEPDQVNKQIKNDQNQDGWSADQPAAQLGLEYFYKANMMERLLDFVLQDKSPLSQGVQRIKMGGSYQQPNFSSLMKVITQMFAQKAFLLKYKPTATCEKMMYHEDIIEHIIDEHKQSKDFGHQLEQMCKDNLQMTKKLAKIFFRAINQSSSDKVIDSLKSVKKFLLIDDSLKIKRLEWLLGIPQIMTKNPYRSTVYQYGVELIERINDDAYKYVSTLSSSLADDSLLNLLIKQVGRQDGFCIKAIKDLMSMCLQDPIIAKYIYTMAPHTYQFARYTDWFANYINQQKEEMEKMSSYAYYQSRIASTNKAVLHLVKFQVLQSSFMEQDSDLLWQAAQTPEFDAIRETWLFENDEVIKHYPPQVLIGKQVSGEPKTLLEFSDEFVSVKLNEVTCEYMYSNPTKLFNLSLADKLMRTKNFTVMSYQQFSNYKTSLSSAEKVAEGGQDQEVQCEVREWSTGHSEAPVLLQLVVKSKVNGSQKVEVTVGLQGEARNVILPETAMKESIFGGDSRVFAHFVKIEPMKDWGGQFSLSVRAAGATSQLSSTAATTSQPLRVKQTTTADTSAAATSTDTRTFACNNCHWIAYEGMQFCENCGESLDDSDLMEDYYTPQQ